MASAAPSAATPVVPNTQGAQDPSALTTQQINERVTSTREILEARLDGMDKAVDLLQKRADASPSIAQVNDAVMALEKLHEEKFASIQTQFRERDTRTEQTSRDSKIAIDAALQAAKEAVGKTEQTFTKQIDQIGALISTTAKGADDKISDLKDRLTALESRGVGAVQATVQHQQQGRDNTGFIALIISSVVAVVSVITVVVLLIRAPAPSPNNARVLYPMTEIYYGLYLDNRPVSRPGVHRIRALEILQCATC